MWRRGRRQLIWGSCRARVCNVALLMTLVTDLPTGAYSYILDAFGSFKLSAAGSYMVVSRPDNIVNTTTFQLPVDVIMAGDAQYKQTITDHDPRSGGKNRVVASASSQRLSMRMRPCLTGR